MSRDGNDLHGVPMSEEALERKLTALGPLMRRQEEAESEIDELFAVRLRAHLLDSEELAPHPTFARNLRARLLPRRGARPLHNPNAIPWWRWAGVSAFATAAVVAVILFGSMRPSNQNGTSLVAPYPRKAELSFSFPSLPVVIHRLAATLSLVHPVAGLPFAGHLHLAAPSFPLQPARLPAYRLASSTDVVYSGRTVLGIRSPVRRAIVHGEPWLVAQDGGGRTGRPLHSLAVSARSGLVIYHDRRNRVLPHATHPMSDGHAVAAARAWLSTLGWYGDRMPLRSVGEAPGRTHVRAVVLGWSGAGPAATEEATMWVTPNGSVIEAWVWPPIAQRGSVTARPIAAAWNDVQHGTLPLAVQGVSPRSRATGVGRVLGTQVVSVLTASRTGVMYLVPAYRFSGTAQVVGTHFWFSLAPSESP